MAGSDQDVLENFLGMRVECDAPNEVLYKFTGNMTVKDEQVGIDIN